MAWGLDFTYRPITQSMDTENRTDRGADDADSASDRVRSAVAGDPAALDWLVGWLSPLMVSWARSQTRGEVVWALTPEDLVQDTWVRVLPKLGELQPHAASGRRMTPALIGIVSRTLRNRVIDVRRAATRRRLFPLPNDTALGIQAVASSSGPFTKAVHSERSRLLEQALQHLTDKQRGIYLERLFEGSSINELAAAYEMSPAAVIKARQRVRHRLEGILAPNILDDLDDL